MEGHLQQPQAQQPQVDGSHVRACLRDLAMRIGLRYGSIRMIFSGGRAIAVAPTYTQRAEDTPPRWYEGLEDDPLCRRLLECVTERYGFQEGSVSAAIHDYDVREYRAEPWYSHEMRPPPVAPQV